MGVLVFCFAFTIVFGDSVLTVRRLGSPDYTDGRLSKTSKEGCLSEKTAKPAIRASSIGMLRNAAVFRSMIGNFWKSFRMHLTDWGGMRYFQELEDLLRKICAYLVLWAWFFPCVMAQDKADLARSMLQEFDQRLDYYWNQPSKYLRERESLRWEILRTLKSMPIGKQLPGGVVLDHGVVTISSETSPQLISLPIRLADVCFMINPEASQADDPSAALMERNEKKNLLERGVRPADIETLAAVTRGARSFQSYIDQGEARFWADKNSDEATTRATIRIIREHLPSQWMEEVLGHLSIPSAKALIRYLIDDMTYNGVTIQQEFIGEGKDE